MKAVPQRMQGRQQNQIDPLAVMPAKTARDVIDPGLCLGYGDTEILKGRHNYLPNYLTFSAKAGPGICARSSDAVCFVAFLAAALCGPGGDVWLNDHEFCLAN
jgi:hypothetical protein